MGETYLDHEPTEVRFKQRERAVLFSDDHVEVAVAVHVVELRRGKLSHVDGFSAAIFGNGQGGQREFRPRSGRSHVCEFVNASQLVADKDVEVAVTVQVAKGRVGAFDLEVRQGNPIEVDEVKLRFCGGAAIAEDGHGGGGLVHAFVTFLVGHGQIQQSVAIESRGRTDTHRAPNRSCRLASRCR